MFDWEADPQGRLLCSAGNQVGRQGVSLQAQARPSVGRQGQPHLQGVQSLSKALSLLSACELQAHLNEQHVGHTATGGAE